MREIPRDPQLDGSLSLLGEGYSFIPSRCQRLGSDIFQVRLLLQDTICISGEEAARLFYDERRFERHKAAPRLLQKTLFGQGGVQGLDGQAHRHRKGLFLSLLGEESIAELVRLSEANWLAAIETWRAQDRVTLLPEVEAILTRAVCAWAGIALPEDSVKRRRDQLAAMIDGAGGIGARHWQARRARKEAEAWLAELLARVRDGALPVDTGRPLAVVAVHRDLDGQLLPLEVAAVEMLNLLRPTVAVARFVIYATLELHAHPHWRERLQTQDDAIELFAQEVRRLYAFFPFTAARVREDFEWRGYRFEKGKRVLLDLYGTNRDARAWDDPGAFRPERFASRIPGSFDFISQGGGDAVGGHRCPGEPLAIALLCSALRMLTRRMRYGIPAQDLRIDLSRMPAQPESLMVLSDVQPVSAQPSAG